VLGLKLERCGCFACVVVPGQGVDVDGVVVLPNRCCLVDVSRAGEERPMGGW
jgi:hypothetical protein